MEQKRDGQLTSEEQRNIMSELELDTLKKKQDELLGNEYEKSFLGGTGDNNVGLTMAELQERTMVLEKELNYQKGLLSRLQSPTNSNTSNNNSKNMSSPSSFSSPRATLLQASNTQNLDNTSNNFGSSRISNNSIQIEDAYGGLLTELQDVRNQISQYVEGGNSVNINSKNINGKQYDNINPKLDKSLHVRSVSPLSNASSSTKKYIGGSRSNNRNSAFVINKGNNSNINAKKNMKKKQQQHGSSPQQQQQPQTRVKSRRAKKIKEYRERFLEEREVLLADLEQRLSRDSARSARNTLNSSLRPNDVDIMSKDAARTRGSRLSNLTNEFVVETQDALRNMRERLENDYARSIQSVRAAFEEDKERLLLELETAGRIEKEEAIRLIYEEQRAEKERLVSMEHRKARDEMNREIASLKATLKSQLTKPASELVLTDDRFQILADEELRLRESLEEERLALQIKFKDQLEVQIQEQRKKLSDEHRERVEALTLEVLQSHERQLKVERKKLILEQQEESETVLKELGEALRYGTETNVKKLKRELEHETKGKVNNLKDQMQRHEKSEMAKLRRRLKQDSDKQMRLVREEAASNLEIESAKLHAEMKTDHAAKMHKLQLDLKGQREREIKNVRKVAEEEFQSKVTRMKLSLQHDLDERASEFKIQRMKDLEKRLDGRIEEGKMSERVLLAALREKFNEEASKAFHMVDDYFAILKKPVSAQYVDVEIPNTKDEMKRRLNSLRNQFDTFMMKYEMASDRVLELQKALINAQVDATRKERLIDELRDGKTGRSEVELNARKLYKANEYLMETLNKNKRMIHQGGDRSASNMI
jgi:hypothetical protein